MMSKAVHARQTTTPWSVPVTLQDVPEDGLQLELKADEATRAAVAKSAGLRALPRLKASFEVKRHPGNGLHVIGHVSATVGQDCVVTLDPVENELEEQVDLLFLHGAPMETVDGADEAPEPLVNETIDLGVIATEFLILGIDPYPRKPEAVFQAPKAEDEAGSHPFAALAALQKKTGQP